MLKAQLDLFNCAFSLPPHFLFTIVIGFQRLIKNVFCGISADLISYFSKQILI